MHYFYVLQSRKNSNWFYKGSTNDLRKRVTEHQRGEVTSTKPYLPLHLVYYEAYVNEKAAREREVSVKKSGSVWMPLMKRIKKSLDD
jgi:putative endonuclease